MTAKFQYRFFVFACLCAVAFYNPLGIISDQFQKLFLYGCILGGLILFTMFSSKQYVCVTYPKGFYMLLYIGFCTSVFSGFVLHDQSAKTSLISVCGYAIPYLTLPLMVKLQISENKILKTFWVLCCISGVVYIINYVTFPNVLFGTVNFDVENTTRGFNRLIAPMLEVMVMMLFYYLNKISLNRGVGHRKLWWKVGLMYFFIITSLTRQIIFMSSLLGMWIYLRGKGSAARFFISLFLAVFISVVIPQIPLYQALKSVTQEDTKGGIQNNIRYKAWEFYLVDYQTDWLTPIIGNGVPALESSPWGRRVDAKTNSQYGGNGCYTTDVGWAGFFWNFGAIATIGLIGLLGKGILKKKNKEHQYITYWLLYIMATAFMSGPILYRRQIFFLCVGLYLAYSSDRKQKAYSQFKVN